jgi:hypothetical protein
MVAHTYNPVTQETEAEGSQVQGPLLSPKTREGKDNSSTGKELA